jgi:hypothetical protein
VFGTTRNRSSGRKEAADAGAVAALVEDIMVELSNVARQEFCRVTENFES